MSSMYVGAGCQVVRPGVTVESIFVPEYDFRPEKLVMAADATEHFHVDGFFVNGDRFSFPFDVATRQRVAAKITNKSSETREIRCALIGEKIVRTADE